MGAQAVRLSNVDIDNALKDKDFEVLFQPIFDLGNGALARVETFIRWRHPSLGVLPPGAFISFFETQGRMSELTRYVLAMALFEYKAWRGPHAPGFSINLAISDLSDESFPSHFTVLLRESGFPAELVTLECPMPPVDADIETTARQLQRLSETGARLAIEVRGRANDFLKTVRPFPFAEIKTGGAAILRFARTVRGPGLSAISELLELAADQNAAITAVGVEDQASLAALRGLGFAAAQGNHLARVGALSQFMPSHVNDVRALLGLEPFSSEDLAALFRKGGPKLSAAPAKIDDDAPQEELINDELTPAAPASDPASDAVSDDDLVERLAARIARADAPKTADPDATARAKAAAIARARRKTMARQKLAARNALKAKAEERAETHAPRDMQERLSREFEAYSDNPMPDDEFDIEPEKASRPEEPAAHNTADAPVAETAPEPAAQVPADPMLDAELNEPATAAEPHGGSHMEVPGATARFKPTIRVTSPEYVPDEDIGDLYAEEDTGITAAAPQAAPTDAPLATAPEISEAEPAEPASADQEAVEDTIPEPMSSAQWVEESFAVETTEEDPPRGKSFLQRTVIPASALRPPKYFWPRGVRKWMRQRAASRAE
jgi:EAL domain-containing protein (putative c-di-GMP-specific phosphodiesterase class I)